MFEGQIKRQIEELLQPYVEKVEELEKHILQLKKRVDTLETEKATVAQPSVPEKEPTQPEAFVPQDMPTGTMTDMSPTAASTEGVYFMDAPNAEGFFHAFEKAEQVGRSIYQLCTKDGVNGTFIMLDTPDAIATAMISVSQFVKPACKVVGNVSAYPQRIQTEEEGAAVCENGVWRVTSKAVVRFE